MVSLYRYVPYTPLLVKSLAEVMQNVRRYLYILNWQCYLCAHTLYKHIPMPLASRHYNILCKEGEAT
jgi:hypothetical protein